MSEVLRNDQELDRAHLFFNTHVSPPDDYDDYSREQFDLWTKSQEEAVANGQRTRPMWLRTNGDFSTEFSARIQYVIMSDPNTIWRIFAAIDISSDGGQTEIRTELPSNATGEPEAKLTEAYTLPALGRAITLAETQVNGS